MKSQNNNNSINRPIQLDFKAEFLTPGAEKVGKYQFVQLKPETSLPNSLNIILPINYMLSTSDKSNCWFHCFVRDEEFNRLWNNPCKYDSQILEAKGFISTDFSLYRDMSLDEVVCNCRKNRAHAYHIQNLGGRVIPTAGFGAEWTWEWIFDGLPYNSPLAITTNGGLSDPEARRLFVGGVDALVKKKHPSALVVCGNYPEWLDTKYPDIQIVKIPNFNQFRRGQLSN